MKSRGPRHCSPVYPAISRPAVVGDPKRNSSPRTLVSRIDQSSTHAPRTTSTVWTLSPRSSRAHSAPPFSTQVSSSTQANRSSSTTNDGNPSCRIHPIRSGNGR
ncbi:hypothetical protein GCM10018789_40650 [Streptomyces werraensis]|nr:hypothetical protein GCM10018789_40650 [Streptomyces werraensis]